MLLPGRGALMTHYLELPTRGVKIAVGITYHIQVG